MDCFLFSIKIQGMNWSFNIGLGLLGGDNMKKLVCGERDKNVEPGSFEYFFFGWYRIKKGEGVTGINKICWTLINMRVSGRLSSPCMEGKKSTCIKEKELKAKYWMRLGMRGERGGKRGKGGAYERLEILQLNFI